MILPMDRAFKRLERPLTIDTFPAKGMDDGRGSLGPATLISIKGVVQNVTPKDLKILPEGDRDVEAIKVHTTALLESKDQVHYDGAKWRVYNNAIRHIGNYAKVIAIRIDE